MQSIIASYLDSSSESSPTKSPAAYDHSNFSSTAPAGSSASGEDKDGGHLMEVSASIAAVTCSEGQSCQLLDASDSAQAASANESCCSLAVDQSSQVAAEDKRSSLLDQSAQAMATEGVAVLDESSQLLDLVPADEAHPTANMACTRSRKTSAVADDVSSTKKAAICTASGGRKYCVLYEGNSSKRWDGKQIMVDGETLESLYSVEDLVLGENVVIPWPGRGGKVENWKGILVDPAGSAGNKSKSKASNRKGQSHSHTQSSKQEREPQASKQNLKGDIQASKQKGGKKRAPGRAEKKAGTIICIGQESPTKYTGKDSSSKASEDCHSQGSHPPKKKKPSTSDKLDKMFTQLIQQQDKIIDILAVLANKSVDQAVLQTPSSINPCRSSEEKQITLGTSDQPKFGQELRLPGSNSSLSVYCESNPEDQLLSDMDQSPLPPPLPSSEHVHVGQTLHPSDQVPQRQQRTSLPPLPPQKFPQQFSALSSPSGDLGPLQPFPPSCAPPRSSSSELTLSSASGTSWSCQPLSPLSSSSEMALSHSSGSCQPLSPLSSSSEMALSHSSGSCQPLSPLPPPSSSSGLAYSSGSHHPLSPLPHWTGGSLQPLPPLPSRSGLANPQNFGSSGSHQQLPLPSRSFPHTCNTRSSGSRQQLPHSSRSGLALPHNYSGSSGSRTPAISCAPTSFRRIWSGTSSKFRLMSATCCVPKLRPSVPSAESLFQEDADSALSAAVADFWSDDHEDSDYDSMMNYYSSSSRSGSAGEKRSITPLLSPPQRANTSTFEDSSPLPQIELITVEEVMAKYGGTDTASLRNLTTALAREAVFGKSEMAKKSLSGRKNTQILDKAKIDYIKTLVRSRVQDKSQVEFEHVWTLCRSSLSKSCQTLRNRSKKL